jgi:hypothetical protein
MVRRVSIVLVALAIAAAMAGQASAAGADWWVYMQPTQGAIVGPTSTFGCKAGAGNGIDPMDAQFMVPPANAAYVISDIGLPARQYYRDFRAPMLAGETKTWNLVVCGPRVYPVPITYLDLWTTTVWDYDPRFSAEIWKGRQLVLVLAPNSSYTLVWQGFGDQIPFQMIARVVPEPATVLGLLWGLGALMIRRRRFTG